MYNEEEDKQFMLNYFRNIISEDERFNALIDEHAKNWEGRQNCFYRCRYYESRTWRVNRFSKPFLLVLH